MNEYDAFGSDELTKIGSPRANKLAYVQDADLQINMPNIKDIGDLEDTRTFKNIMAKYVADVNTLQNESDAQVQRLVAGETEDLHQVMLAMDEAETSFDLMMEIRNKLVDAYQELMRMQV